MEGPTTQARQSAPAGRVTGYFYLLSLTVQAQGPKAVAAAFGNWLMSHLVTALARRQLPLGSWSQLEGWPCRGLCGPSPEVSRGEDGEMKFGEARGPQKGGWGRGVG